ncbi:MAG: hypothetical protein ASARMPRED_005303 [Alectoria sarmentosa]|nr:MAG: hypothetical protein ASARMPRED_005303 [Alectoria sarmentosa]
MSQISYALGRGYLASVRLYAQHWMWRFQLGYLLHPTIPQDKEDLKIADIACGTGIWLIEVARTLPASTQLDGYDISPAQYPPKEWLPKNVNLNVLDMLDPVPEELIGKYDVVHVGLIVMVVRNENPTPVLNNLMALLKPGGYLQWDESDMNSLTVAHADGLTPHPRTNVYENDKERYLITTALLCRWATQIDKLFIGHGLELCFYQRLPIKDEIKKPWTDVQVTAGGEQIKNVVIPACKEGEEPSPEKWLQLLDGLVAESQRNQAHTMDMIVAIYEKNPGVSGTWYENTYPGCACDIPAHNYTFSFEPKHDWSSVYASSSEINDYFNDFSKKYCLHKYIKTRHVVSKACWSEEQGKWIVTIEDAISGQTLEDSCDILIQAAGYLNNWAWPDIRGLDKLKGTMLHTAKWDNTVDLKGKQVGLIGNGQDFLPAIQPVVKTLTAFIRSPAWVLPTIGTAQRVYSREEIEVFAEDPEKLTAHRKANETMMNSIFSVYLQDSRLQKMLKARCINEMKQILQNDDLAEKFIPTYSVGCSRLTPSPGYLETMRKDNVTAVHSAVTELTETGCICENGEEFPLDVLVCASGFDTSYRTRFPIIGPGGISLEHDWANELKCYLGIAAAGFPNYCMSLGPYSPVGAGSSSNLLNNMSPVPTETQIDHILKLVDRYQTERIHSFRPSPTAVSDFLAHTAPVRMKLGNPLQLLRYLLVEALPHVRSS